MFKVNSSLNFQSVSLVAQGKGTEAHWVPNTDVYVIEGGLVVKIELAGMKREDLSLSIEGSRLRISGHRPDSCRPPHCRFLVMEINYGGFESVIELPPGYDPAKAKAAYQNGFLRIDIPAQAKSPQQHITVETHGC